MIRSLILFALTCLCYFTSGWGQITDHLQTDFSCRSISPIQGVDAIYLINLDGRPEKYQKTMEELVPWGIIPYRFPAIYGWELPTSTINDAGITFDPEMEHGHWVRIFPGDDSPQGEYEVLSNDSCGKKIFFRDCL